MPCWPQARMMLPDSSLPHTQCLQHFRCQPHGAGPNILLGPRRDARTSATLERNIGIEARTLLSASRRCAVRMVCATHALSEITEDHGELANCLAVMDADIAQTIRSVSCNEEIESGRERARTRTRSACRPDLEAQGRCPCPRHTMTSTDQRVLPFSGCCCASNAFEWPFSGRGGACC
ncbi:hypothetical protein GGX14DRAFT_573661 [Mycena pura]|uniref:Uncharacterized protein n=1 Tax=Mycena pura TaxID=153505 RepID=A0AAD6V2H3_9AGAR|nr:hypothetical protein GGX14DRAFT_573661 [Mycena pura]